MSKMSEKDLISFIRAGSSASLFLMYGPDEYSKNICYKRIIKTFCSSSEPILIDGQALDMQRLHEECCSVSFFSNEKCICVRNPSIESFSQGQAETLYSIIEQKPESTVLIFIVKSQEVNTRSSAKWAKFIKTIESAGIVVECAQKSQSDVISMITNTAKKHGCSISPSLAANFAERCLNDMLLIENDLVKLCAFALQKNDGVISLDAIENLTARQLDYRAFEIVRQVINKKSESALNILDSLFLQQVDAIAINSALASSLLDIYRVKIMQAYNHSISELTSEYDYKGKDFKLRGAGYDAPKCSLNFLKNAIKCLANADVILKSTKDNKKTVMERALLSIILEKEFAAQ